MRKGEDRKKMDRVNLNLKPWAVLATLFFAAVALADPPSSTSATAASGAATDAASNKLQEMQRQLDILAQEIQNLKTGGAAAPTADRMELGFGPGASKVYRAQPGVTLGGYGEIGFERFSRGFNADGTMLPGKRFAPGEDSSPGQSRVDITRAVVYVGYKFNDDWVLNSEIEWEHGGDEIEVEFLYLDYFNRKELNFRAGNLLMPVGLTNETHEPTTYLGAHRPTLETLIVPSTWSEEGLGAFGEIGSVTYRTYAVTGLNASGFDAANGVHEGRHESGFGNATHWTWVARADYTGEPGLLAGGSFYIGSASTQPTAGFDLISVPMKLLELHTQYNWHAFDLRAMAAYSILSNVDQLDAEKAVALTDSVGSRQGGFYLEGGYDLLNGQKQSVVPFLRWEMLDTQISVPDGYTKNSANLIRELVAGVNYKPIPQLVFKADYEWYFLTQDSGVNQADVSMGYVF